MFLDHFGLREYPYSLTPDPTFFFESDVSQEGLNTILMALGMGEGFIKITGEVGTGKSMLCRKVIASLDSNYQVALILNPYRDAQSLFLELCKEFGATYPADQEDNQFAVLNALTEQVMKLNKAGKRLVICLDEAQGMPIQTLESLRLLTNLETEKRKLVQIIIFGQPELEDNLNHPSIRQLKQRITFSYHMRPLGASQLSAYLRHRLQAAGHPDGLLFTQLATQDILKFSGSVPRMVNILAHKSLLSAYGKGRTFVDKADVMAAIKDTPAAALNYKKHIKRNALTGIGIAGALLAVGISVWAYMNNYRFIWPFSGSL
jgi:MSHA biogenesis protein MshM